MGFQKMLTFSEIRLGLSWLSPCRTERSAPGDGEGGVMSSAGPSKGELAS